MKKVVLIVFLETQVETGCQETGGVGKANVKEMCQKTSCKTSFQNFGKWEAVDSTRNQEGEKIKEESQAACSRKHHQPIWRDISLPKVFYCLLILLLMTLLLTVITQNTVTTENWTYSLPEYGGAAISLVNRGGDF